MAELKKPIDLAFLEKQLTEITNALPEAKTLKEVKLLLEKSRVLMGRIDHTKLVFDDTAWTRFVADFGLLGESKNAILLRCETILLSHVRKLSQLLEDKEALEANEKARQCIVSKPQKRVAEVKPKERSKPVIALLHTKDRSKEEIKYFVDPIDGEPVWVHVNALSPEQEYIFVSDAGQVPPYEIHMRCLDNHTFEVTLLVADPCDLATREGKKHLFAKLSLRNNKLDENSFEHKLIKKHILEKIVSDAPIDDQPLAIFLNDQNLIDAWINRMAEEFEAKPATLKQVLSHAFFSVTVYPRVLRTDLGTQTLWEFEEGESLPLRLDRHFSTQP